jgi:hypothetical protein
MAARPARVESRSLDLPDIRRRELSVGRGISLAQASDEKEDTVMFSFVLGSLAGGLAVWYWGEQLREFAESKTRGVRKGAADTLKTVEKTAESVLDRTKEQVSAALQAGQDAIRPPHAIR